MSKFETKNRIDNFIYRTYNAASSVIFSLRRDSKRTLERNQAYKNIHKGDRCFILGTGPSLNLLTDPQIRQLSREIIFGTNSLYKADAISSITPKYYALLDNLYWEQWANTFNDVVERYGRSPPIFITDLRAKKLAEEARQVDHIYIYSKKYPTSTMSDQIHSNIYAAMNVVSYCILVASYMGFKEIYLLGCDYNAFCTSGRGHAYNDKSELDQSSYNLAFYLKFYWLTTEFHYLIERLTRSKGVDVINLTPGTLLDAYKRLPIEDVIGKERNTI